MGFLFSKPSYDPDRDIPNLDGKIVVVTGSSSGIGYRTAEQLAIHGEDKLIWVPLELSSVRSAKKAAELILAKEKRLDILVNNAGHLPSDYEPTEDGIDKTVAVNHVGHFVFTTTLLPLLKSTTLETGADVRIVNVASISYKAAGRVKFDSLDDFNDKRTGTWFVKFRRYGRSKLMNMLFSTELQRRLDDEGAAIIVTSVHPGAVHTEGADNNNPIFIKVILPFFCVSSLKGAYTSLFAATSAEVAALPDKYKGKYMEGCRVVKPSTKEAEDELLARKLWETTKKVVADVLASSQ
ncbi:hypothetical protein EW146_g3110 [Bondarzewia mesenterica]|uniref:NAD(P)-binding protein n=1 Tax=Bondarzewia mesenterica TaxID=1095465 RepID=A0A4V3XFJ5_9AGAM|nr:hypothetical protein EW146_g3110 [Bondarzewia mesenterica]